MKFLLRKYAIEIRRVSSLGKYTMLILCDARILQILKEYELKANTFTGIKNTPGSYNRK